MKSEIQSINRQTGKIMDVRKGIESMGPENHISSEKLFGSENMNKPGLAKNSATTEADLFKAAHESKPAFDKVVIDDGEGVSEDIGAPNR